MKKTLLLFSILCMFIANAQVANQPSNLEVCDDNTDGIFCFNLTIQNSQILGSQNPVDYILSYHLTQSDADFGVNAINPNSYCNTTSPETIFARLEDISNGMFDTTSFDLLVNIPPSLVQAVPLEVCDDDFDQIATFDLTSKEAEILGGQTGITLQYYANPQDLTNNVPIANPTMYQNVQLGVQTIFVRATATLSGCENTVTFNVRVLPTPSPNQNPTPIEVCDDDTDGIVVVDITLRENEILNGEVGITASYHFSQTDAELGQNFIADPTQHTVDTVNANSDNEVIIYVRVESDFSIDSNNEPCYAVVELPVVINSLPVLTSSMYSYVFCELDNDNIGQFNWDEVTAALNLVQAPQNINDFTVTYHSTVADAINNTSALVNGYENFIDPQTVYIRVENTATGCFNANNIASLALQVDPVPTATQPSLYEVCAEDASNQNVGIFDLSTLNSSIIGGQSNVEVLYYETSADAMNTTNTLSSIYINSFNPQTLYTRTQNVITGCYSNVVAIGLQVNPLPAVTLPEDSFVCVDSNTGLLFTPFSIGTDLGPGISYQWSTPNGNSNTPTVIVTVPGTYSLNVTDFNSSNSCDYFDSVTFTGEFAPCSLSVEETSLNAITIYPNPVRSELIVTSETNLQIESLAIYSLEGKRIRQQTQDFDQEEIRVNVADFTAGFYILKIQTVDSKILTKRFIVQ